MDGCHEDHKGTFSITTERKEKEMNLRRKKRIIIALVLMLALALGVSPMVYAGGGSGETPTEPVATLTGIDPPPGFTSDANKYMAYSTQDAFIKYSGVFDDKWISLGTIIPILRTGDTTYYGVHINDLSPFIVTPKPTFSADGKTLLFNYEVALKPLVTPKVEAPPVPFDFGIMGDLRSSGTDMPFVSMSYDNQGVLVSHADILNADGASAEHFLHFGGTGLGGMLSGIWVGDLGDFNELAAFANRPMNLQDGESPMVSGFWLGMEMTYSDAPMTFGAQANMIEEEPESIPEDDVTKPEPPKDSGKVTQKAPKTGDNSIAGVIAIIMVVGAAVAILIGKKKPRSMK